MELITNQENLSHALSTVSRVASTRSQLPILSNILLRVDSGRLLVAATNLEVASTEYIGAKIIKPGAITIPAKLISEFVSNLPKSEPIELKTTGDSLHINSGNYTSVINGVGSEDFPELPIINEKQSISYSISTEDLKQAIAQTIISASSDSARPILTGVYWHSHDGFLYLASTDGYRLSERKLVKTSSDVAAIVPVTTLQEVLRTITDDIDTVDILFDETQVRFRLGESEIISRLIDGNFPDYRQLIPKQSDIITEVEKASLVRVIKIASLFARESGGSVTITTDNDKNTLGVHSIASELGENSSEITAKTNGGGAITLNSRYISDALGVIEGDKISFEFSSKSSPSIVRAVGDSNYYHLIMPLKS